MGSLLQGARSLPRSGHIPRYGTPASASAWGVFPGSGSVSEMESAVNAGVCPGLVEPLA